MSNPTRTPVTMYPESVTVGYIRTGKNGSGKLRYTATAIGGGRIGTFDRYREASDALLAHARKVKPEPATTARETAAQYRERLVAELVAETMQCDREHRYARSYGILAGLVRGIATDVSSAELAREYVRQMDAATNRPNIDPAELIRRSQEDAPRVSERTPC